MVFTLGTFFVGPLSDSLNRDGAGRGNDGFLHDHYVEEAETAERQAREEIGKSLSACWKIGTSSIRPNLTDDVDCLFKMEHFSIHGEPDGCCSHNRVKIDRSTHSKEHFHC